MISEEIIKKAIEQLIKAAKPQKIYLFGSYARGDARKQSDLDFLVVEQVLKSRRKEMVRLHDAIRSMCIPVDILVMSESTFNEWSDVPGTVMYRAKTEGRLCYEKS
ncbi:nucleotidyltransferase domain-containing protein [bacterium]|nr:nucleotidyltransferase domain-containing protein [bacterium]MBU0899873.1 nucleotidyltransferase domain-containing protein [bacterium]MBU1152755.1 nucleotidyltransferase domain-containing protein [bacterium]MBU1782657.1 nucleotidyltransferase domain-containing protein [bacterium]MBU2600523.1 nucleotidyltransferase domain-containing protein [bacterium]